MEFIFFAHVQCTSHILEALFYKYLKAQRDGVGIFK